MLSDICRELRNYFIRGNEDKHFGTFTIADNTVYPNDFLSDGQYFRIVGSKFNDGVYRYGDRLYLNDEEFDGAVWAMCVPNEIISLDSDIETWKNKYEEQARSPFMSESFGGYSYTKSNQSSIVNTDWQSAFKSRLNKWRKI